MHDRERIPKAIIEKYANSICFTVDIDQRLMEVVEPHTSWILPMAYEVDGQVLELYAQHLLSQLVDLKEEKFGTYKGKSLSLHKQFKKMVI